MSSLLARRRLLPWLALLLGLCLAAALPAALADEDPGDASDRTDAEAEAESDTEEDTEADTESEADATPAPTLHKVYVPYRDLSKVFEKEGEGVFLPYEEFLDLWGRAHRDEETGADEPPVGAVVRAAAYAGEASTEQVRLTAKLEVDVLAEGWQRIPLDFSGAGIERAEIDGEPALLVPAAKGVHLLLENPGRRTLELDLRIAARHEGDRHTAQFSLPGVPLSRLDLVVPGSATDVEVAPRLASTTQPTKDGRTKLVAFLGSVEGVAITWHQKVEEGPQVEPLVFAEERHDVRADRGVLRSELVADLSVLRAPLGKVRITVPSDVVTLYVQGDGIQTWERSDDGTTIDVSLREPVREAWQLRLGLERPLPDLPADVVLPLAALEGVERETGFVRLLMGEGVKLDPKATPGLLQIDVQELPDPLKGAPPGRALAYRFPARPGASTVTVESLKPRLLVQSGTRVGIRPEAIDVTYSALLSVERAGIFGASFDVPEDLEITAVRVSGIEYDDHQVREVDGKRVLRVEFRDRLLGGGAVIFIEGRMPSPLPTGEDDESEVESAAPMLVLRDADHLTGYLAVHLDGAIDHRVVSKTGLVVLDANAPAAYEPPPLPLPLSYRFEHHEGEIGLTLGLARRAPAVTARVETAVRLEPDRMRLSATLRYRISYRGIDTLRFTAPLALSDLLHLDLEGAQLLDPVPLESDEGGEKRGIWTIKLPSPRTGEIPIVLDIEDVPQKALDSGESRLDEVPTFVPLAEGETPLPNTVHDVAVRRDRLLEVSADLLKGAEEIDTRELPATLRDEDDFLAIRSWDPTWEGRLLVTRHDYEPVAEVVVSHMHLDTVLPRQGRATTEAYLKVMNNQRQSLEIALPPDFEIRAVEVDGASRTPRQGEDGAVLVPLPSGLGKDEAFVVALAFDHEVDRSGALLFDTVRAVSPVPKRVTADVLTWRVFAPADAAYVGFGGDLEPADPYRSWFAGLVDDLSRLIGERAGGGTLDVASMAGGFESPFQTRHEGRVFLFSNRVGTGEVALTSADTASFAFWKILWFAVALAALLALMPFIGRLGFGEGTVFAAAVLILLVLLVRAGPGAAQVLNAMLFGVLIAGAFRLFVNGARRASERAAEADAKARADEHEPDSESEPEPEGGVA